ncbi:MAG: radical SAM family heme chaperone HemW [Bacteroidota bacterium]
MAGIYIHIPFCKQSCHYCDFYFSTSLKNKNLFLDALKKEIYMRKDYLITKNIDTIYFGGGTPSLLSREDILCIFAELEKYFSISSDAEITLEANPDDLSRKKLREFYSTFINRLSIGIQSFSDEDLKFLNRVHNSYEALTSVKQAQDIGFSNITIDLIYGIQTLSDEQWKKNLDVAFSLGVPHISCYCLTLEPKTALHSFIKRGLAKAIDEQKGARQFDILMNEMKNNNFTQYEISNFCKDGFYSRHNSSYWKGEKYLGLGPSAHSYNGDSRQWNINNNSIYIRSMNEEKICFEKEILSDEKKYNEYVMTSLRTMWGLDLNYLKENFSVSFYDYFMKESIRLLEEESIKIDGSQIVLTQKGKLLADNIISKLFFVVI